MESKAACPFARRPINHARLVHSALVASRGFNLDAAYAADCCTPQTPRHAGERFYSSRKFVWRWRALSWPAVTHTLRMP